MCNRVLGIGMSVILIAAVYITSVYGLNMAAATNEVQTVIVIDPGHGGVDPGKIGVNGELEKDINLAISYKLKQILEDKGFQVVLTREDDKGLYQESDANKKASDMRARCKIIEEKDAALVVSIHQNSYTDEEVSGAQVFYYKHSSAGKELAETVQNSIKENVPEAGERVVKSNDNYYMLIHTPCPTIIVECGFLSNYAEAKRLTGDEYQGQIAMAVAGGIVDFMKPND